MDYKYYIKIDENNNIVDSKTNVYIKGQISNWIFIKETNSRQEGNKLILKDDNGYYKYKYENNEIIEKSDNDLLVELNNDNEKKLVQLRIIRDGLLMSTIWIQQRHIGEREGLTSGITTKETTLTDTQFNSWLLYWEALRDLPENVDVSTVDYSDIISLFPEIPEIK